MKVEIISGIPSGEVVRSWDSLCEQTELASLFLTHTWADCAAEAFSQTTEAITLLVTEGAELIGVAALAASRDSRAKIRFLSDGLADYNDFVSKPQHRHHVVRSCILELANAGVEEVQLGNLPLQSQTLEALRAQPSPWKAVQLRPGIAPRVELCEAASTKVRSRIHSRRKLRQKLASFGPLELHCLDDASRLTRGLEEFFTAHSRRFQARGETSPFEAHAARNFQIGLATRLAPRKQMRLFILTVGGVPAAWGLVLVWRDDWLWYMPTFNLDYEKFSPGVVLLDLVLLQAMSEGVKVLDLGIGDETYKQRFANGKTEVARVVLTRSIPRYLRLRLRVAAASLLARSPALDRLARAQLRKPRAKKPGTKTPQ